MVERRTHALAGRRRRTREHVGPPVEPQENERRLREERFEHRHLGDEWRDVRYELVGRALRIGVTAGHDRRGGFEVHVVVVVHQRIQADLRAGLLDEALVNRRRLRIALHRRIEIAGAHVDVRRHVHEVTGLGHQRFETTRRGHRLLGVRRRFDGVNVVVVRTRVIGSTAQDAFECRDDLGREIGRSAVDCPERPRPQVHHALGIQRLNVRVFRQSPGKTGHRVLISTIELAEIGRRCTRITDHERVDQRALARCSGFFRERLRPGDRFGRALLRLRIDVGIVDVRAERERNAPERHRCRRIELRRAAEHPDGAAVIESVDERQTLIEELLRVRIGGGDFEVVRTETRPQRRRSGRCGAMLMRLGE